MDYISTRGSAPAVGAAEAILTGLAPDGGLYVPASLPGVDFASLRGCTYPQIAFAVLRGFLPEYEDDFLQGILAQTYGDAFGGKAGHLVQLDEDLFSLELWHGPTCAFKDYALQLLPRLIAQARRFRGEVDTTRILVATSGDTGTAALNGFADREGTDICVFYPVDGTSEIQRLQMVTQEGGNINVFAVRGNFDDAQRGVKAAFSDAGLARNLAGQGVRLSSANSINWGRLVPQIVYYATSYLHLWEQGILRYGDKLDFCVPTGNFGDILAGYYAKALGLPIGRLLCASNKNNVLADFLETGRYSAKRSFFKTSSPSMDILVSSNLERLLYHAAGSHEAVCGWMAQLAETGEYTVDAHTLSAIRATFRAGWADENAVYDEIRHMHNQYGYLCDPHTAVAFRVWQQQPGHATRPTVVLSTASPFKFPGHVLSALGRPIPKNEFDALRALEDHSGVAAPASLAGLAQKPVRFNATLLPEDIPAITLTL